MKTLGYRGRQVRIRNILFEIKGNSEKGNFRTVSREWQDFFFKWLEWRRGQNSSRETVGQCSIIWAVNSTS